MKVREVMSAPVITVGPDDSFHEVVGRLLDNDISGVPVVDGAGHLLGMVTEADLVSNEAYGYRRRRALALVGDYLLGRNPSWVVEDGRLVGIVSRHDLLAPFNRTDQAVMADVRAVLADVAQVPESHQVTPAVADGVVTLEGSVQWPRDSALVEAMVARVPGVVAVVNHLVAREPAPHLSRSTGLR